MTQSQYLSMLALATVMGFASLNAQTPLFNDGEAFGGSQIFSEGINPLGNSARFDRLQPQPAVCMTYVDGDRQMQNHTSTLGALGSTNLTPSQISEDLRKLNDSIWGIRTRAYGVAYLADMLNTSYTHEEFNSTLASVDVLPTHLDGLAQLGGNTSTLNIRRSVVNRFASGMGSKQQGMAAGFLVRVERWDLGMETTAVNPFVGQLGLVGGPDPYQFRDTPYKTTAIAMDFGLVTDISEGVRLGGTINRINAKRIWDVQEKPQARLGLQMDIGNLAMLSLESDLNAAMRMPFPVNQRTQAVSLRITANPTVTVILGAELKKLGDQSVTRGGATLQIHLEGFQIGVGMQYCPDKPLRGATVVFD